jgi:hypothetical protein
MSKLNIKQIAGPATGGRAPTGSIPVFDGNQLRWSNSASTGLQLPTGTTAQRPVGANVTNGMFRYNTDLGKIEAFQAGSWINAVSEIKSFLDLTDVSKTYSPGKVLAVNAAGTGIEYIDPTVTLDKIKGTSLTDAGKYVSVKTDGSGLEYLPFPLIGNLRAFKFRINFSSSYMLSASPGQDLPAGWTATAKSGTATETQYSILTITHNIGQPPISGIVYGYQVQSDTFSGRPIGNQSLALTFQPSTASTTFTINGLVTSTAAASAPSGQNTYGVVYLWFYL